MNNQLAAATASRFRFRGHHQAGTTREYAFEDSEEKGPPHRLFVRVDTGLLGKYHVHFQDAPNICLRLLAGRYLASPGAQHEEVRITISDRDLAELTGKAESEQVPKHKRKGK